MKKIAYVEMFNNELTHPWYQSTRRLMLENISKFLDKNSRILDAGCGTGGTIKYLKKFGFSSIYGIDKSNVAVAFCKKRGLKNIRVSSIDKIPYENDYFDAIICMDVLYHKDIKVQKSIEELKRVLKKGGIIYFEEPSYNWLRGTHDDAIETGHRFTLKELKKNLLRADLKIIKGTHFNAILFPLIAFRRLMDKLTGNKRTSSDVYPILGLQAFVINKLLNIELKLTNLVSLPFGLSVIFLCKK